MSDSEQHLSDQIILHFIDKELPAEVVEQVAEHLSSCPECGDRQRKIENTSQVLAEIYRSERSDAISNANASRVRLQQKLAQRPSHLSRFHLLRERLTFRVGLASALVLVCVVLIVYGKKPAWDSGRISTTAQIQSLIPNRSLTPGAVRPVTLSEVCSASDQDLDPKVSPSVEKEFFREYGLPEGTYPGDYQIDYLVNPQLGGTGDIRNLWPETYFDSRWNAHAKDRLERRLQQMVCDRSINLEAAQQEITTDWIGAYKKYVGG